MTTFATCNLYIAVNLSRASQAPAEPMLQFVPCRCQHGPDQTMSLLLVLVAAFTVDVCAAATGKNKLQNKSCCYYSKFVRACCHCKHWQLNLSTVMSVLHAGTVTAREVIEAFKQQ